MKIIVAIIMFLTLSACQVCKPGSMQCKNGQAQLCSNAGTWKVVTDCSKVKSKDGLKWCCKCESNKCYCSKACRCEVK